jgi:hypothetical protein
MTSKEEIALCLYRHYAEGKLKLRKKSGQYIFTTRIKAPGEIFGVVVEIHKRYFCISPWWNAVDIYSDLANEIYRREWDKIKAEDAAKEKQRLKPICKTLELQCGD